MLFGERANDFSLVLLSKRLWREDTVKASVNSAKNLARERDPKPSELAIDRVNFVEGRGEARTREPCNTLG